MLPDIVGQASGRFDQRFFLTALVPTAVFAPATAGVVLVSTGSLSPLIDMYANQTPVVQVLLALGAAAVVWFLATILASQWNHVVRIYEGYSIVEFTAAFNRCLERSPLPARFRLRAPGVAGHQRRLARMRSRDDPAIRSADSAAIAAAYETEPAVRTHYGYPQVMERVLPTSLGNILRAAEDYAEHRYGFDIIHLWTRLSVVLPPDYLADVDKAIMEYQTPLVISFGSAILAVASLGLASANISTVAFLAIFLGASIASWVMYRLSFDGAKVYGDLLRAAVDLFRTDLLERWWPELLSIDDDRIRLELLREFVLSGTKPNLLPAEYELRAARSEVRDSETNLNRLIVVESRTPSKPEPTVPVSGSQTETPPRFGLRLSALITVGVLTFAFFGAQRLNQRVFVVVAGKETAAFSDLSGSVTTVEMRRGSVASDAIAQASTKENLSAKLVDIEQSVVLHRLHINDVVRRSDVGPVLEQDGIVIQLNVGRAEVRALDLRAGEKVLLSVASSSEEPSCPKANRSGDSRTVSNSEPSESSSSRLLDATVLSIVQGDTQDAANLVVQIKASSAPCLGDPTNIQVLRDRNSG